MSTGPIETYKAKLADFEAAWQRRLASEESIENCVAAGEELLKSARALYGNSAAYAEVKSMVRGAEAGAPYLEG